MEILKQGTRPEEITHEGTCNNCKTVVRFHRGEGRITRNQRDGNYVIVNCPTCNGEIHSNI